MGVISLRMNERESAMLKAYIKVNQLNLSTFIREAVLDRFEEELHIEEERIMKARNKIENERSYDHAEVWDTLGI